MRVGLAIETDSPGGAETMLLALARELQLRGHDVAALGPAGKEGWLTARFADMGIDRDLIEVRGLFGLGTVPGIATIIRDRRFDVLHSHEFGFAVAGALAARVAGVRHVITMHGGAAYSLKVRRRLAVRVASALSSHTVAVSHASRSLLAESLHVRAETVEMIHNGLAPAAAGAPRLREELGVGPRDVLLLAIGSLYEVKGHAFLIEALALLEHGAERVVVAIAGTGYWEPTLRSMATDLGVAERVRFLGYRSDVPDLLASADVFVMPSLSEGLPMAMIEAMLAGKAIVASEVGGIPELLNDPGVGLLARPGDARDLAKRLSELIGDAVHRESLGAAARARATEHFTAAAMAEHYLRLYRT